MEIINNAPGAPKPIGPYSQGVAVGETVYLAGQVALHPETGKMVDGGIEEQTARVLENLTAVLEFSGSSWDRVVMTTVFLSEMAHGKVVNQLYAEKVSEFSPPARQTVAVKELPLGAMVEISLIAVRDV